MLRLRQPSEAIRLLEVGAREERTVYGQLSLAQLGEDSPLSWRPPPLDDAQVKKLMQIPAVRRAAALSEIGEAALADREMTRLFAQASDDLAGNLLALVSRMQTPRSEEHTSELQSLMRNSYAVFCLKKKNKQITQTK